MRQEEVPDVIPGKSSLDTFGTLVVRVVACSRVVDQHVNALALSADRGGQDAHVRLRRKISAQKLRTRARVSSTTELSDVLPERLVPSDEHHVSAQTRKGQSRRAPQARRGPGDHAGPTQGVLNC
jgi:hypothetical protein